MDFQNFCTAEKRMKFAIKAIRQYPPYLRHVATLPWEIKHSNLLLAALSPDVQQVADGLNGRVKARLFSTLFR